MREVPKTTCDKCEADISTTGYAEEWRAVITAERMPSWGGVVYSMAKRPPVKRDHHFCDMTCLAAWVAEAVPDAQEKLARKLASREKVNPA